MRNLHYVCGHADWNVKADSRRNFCEASSLMAVAARITLHTVRGSAMHTKVDDLDCLPGLCMTISQAEVGKLHVPMNNAALVQS